jgi:hypothetical protein
MARFVNKRTVGALIAFLVVLLGYLRQVQPVLPDAPAPALAPVEFPSAADAGSDAG